MGVRSTMFRLHAGQKSLCIGAVLDLNLGLAMKKCRLCGRGIAAGEVYGARGNCYADVWKSIVALLITHVPFSGDKCKP